MKVFPHYPCFPCFFVASAAITVILLGCLAISSKTANAAGFAVSPSSLEFTVEKNSQAQRQLRIYNTGKESAGFRAQSSNPVVIRVSPETGFVEAEGSIIVKVTATGSKIGQTNGEVVISFVSFGSHDSYDSRNEVSLELGTAIPVKLTAFKKAEVMANAFIGMLLSASIVFAGLAAYYFAKRKPGRFAADFQSAYDLYHSQK